jgi:hypothetical protein
MMRVCSLQFPLILPSKNVSLAACFNAARGAQMVKTARARYTLEFKQKALRLVRICRDGAHSTATGAINTPVNLKTAVGTP